MRHSEFISVDEILSLRTVLDFQEGRLKKKLGPSGFSDKSRSTSPERAITLICSDACSVIQLFFKSSFFSGLAVLSERPFCI